MSLPQLSRYFRTRNGPKTRKSEKRSGALSILLRSCIQHAVQEVPVLEGQMAQVTPPTNCLHLWAATQPQHSFKRLHQRQRQGFSMAFLSDPTTSAFEHLSFQRSLTGSRAKAVRGGFARIYMSLPGCIEGCPQHESMQPRCAYGPWTLLPHNGVGQAEKTGAGSENSAKTRAGVGSRRVPVLVGQMAQATPRKTSNCLHLWAATQPQHSFKRLHQRQRQGFSMAFLSDPTTSAFEHLSFQRSLIGSRAKAVRGGFARIYMSLPGCIEGCPQHESMQPRCAYGP